MSLSAGENAEIEQDYRDRVLQEQQQLDTRRIALIAFITGDRYGQLPERDQLLLKHQIAVMNEYSNILAQRIERFASKPLSRLYPPPSS